MQIILRRSQRYPVQLGEFRGGESSEKVLFEECSLTGILGFEGIQGVGKNHHVNAARGEGVVQLIKGVSVAVAAAASSTALAPVVDQEISHGQGRGIRQVFSVLDVVQPPLGMNTKIPLVNKVGRPPRLASTLMLDALVGDALELVVDRLHEGRFGAGFAGTY